MLSPSLRQLKILFRFVCQFLQEGIKTVEQILGEDDLCRSAASRSRPGTATWLSDLTAKQIFDAP